MLESVDLSMTLSKKAAKPILSDMEDRLFELTELVFERKAPVIVVLEGWDAAGKGTTIRKLTERLDARGFKVLSTQAPRSHELRKPWLWRFWMNIPRYGQIAVFDRSWYGRVLVERVEGLTPLPAWIRAYEEINDFERTLTNDGTVILKFWLHISKEEQLRRFIELTSNSQTAWQVTAEDWEHHRKYDEYVAAVRDMVANTNTDWAPWTIVPATDRDARLYVVFRSLIERLEDALKLERAGWPELATLARLSDSEVLEKTKIKEKKKDKNKAKGPDTSPDKGKDKKKEKKEKKLKLADELELAELHDTDVDTNGEADTELASAEPMPVSVPATSTPGANGDIKKKAKKNKQNS